MATIEIDGSILEGGGQVVRVAVACSAITLRPVAIHSIRAGRPKPGLQAQHLAGMQLVAQQCGGSLQGARLQATEARLIPRELKGGNLLSDTRTAGSVSLLLQAALAPALLSPRPSRLTLRGGTHVPHAPPAPYLRDVFLPALRAFGGQCSVQIPRVGFFPRGGGEMIVDVTPVRGCLNAVEMLHQGEVVSVYAEAYGEEACVSRLLSLAQSSLRPLAPSLSPTLTPRPLPPSETDGGKIYGINVHLVTSTGVRLGGGCGADRTSRPGEGGAVRAAVDGLRAELGAGVCVDSHLQDQVVLLMGLAAGTSRLRCGALSSHTRTAVALMTRCTEAQYKVVPSEGGTVILECRGAAIAASQLP